MCDERVLDVGQNEHGSDKLFEKLQVMILEKIRLCVDIFSGRLLCIQVEASRSREVNEPYYYPPFNRSTIYLSTVI